MIELNNLLNKKSVLVCSRNLLSQ